MAGSPNLSQAALNHRIDEPAGNCELAMIRSSSAEEIRAVFSSSHLDLVEVSLDEVLDLDFSEDRDLPERPFVLRSATWREDGRVELAARPTPLPSGLTLGWSSPPVHAAFTDNAISVDPIAERDPMPWLVALYDANGTRVSNRVVVDDPGALRDAIRDRVAQSGGRPDEIEGLEMLPLVRLVLWAHDKFIFDPDETAAFRRATDAAAEDAAAADAGEFWER